MSAAAYSPAVAASWPAPTAAGAVDAEVPVPGSKSLTSRELVLAAIADGPGILRAPLQSDDTSRMVAALRALGVGVEAVPGPSGDDLRVTPPVRLCGGGVVDCGQAGTVMRFVTPLAGLADGEVTITAHPTALHRPMGELIRALRQAGMDIDDEGRWSLPFVVRGRGHVRGGDVAVDAGASSQFVSGMLLAAPRFDVGLRLTHTGGPLPSMPHIDMTVACLAARGIHVEETRPGEWIVPAGPVRAKDVTIEPDLSNAAPFLAAAVATGGRVAIPGWPARSIQPGALLPDLLGAFGARASRRHGTLTVRGPERITGVRLDLSAAGELAPTLVGLAALADGESVFTGIGHIRGHESDRLAALVANIRALGGEAEELPDGIRVVPRPLHGGLWRTHHDHRLATTGALVGLVVSGTVVDDITTTAKTLPRFAPMWSDMLAGAVPGG